jgi:endonuclease/exonuclease/phosphatase family metal-dependent hydrolase
MRVFLALLFPLLGWGACKEVRVLTYNIHHGEGIDGKFDLERIAKVIRQSRADIVALQEVDQRTRRIGGVDTLAELARLTQRQPVFGKSMSYDGGEYGNALLVRGEILRHSVHAIPTTPNREPRSILRAEIKLQNCAQPILMMATHWDHQSQPDRLAGAELANKLAIASPDLPAILAGDFNANPTNSAVKMLSGTWMISGAGAELHTFPVEQPKVQIDYILTRPASAWTLRDAKVLPEILASDHRPLLATLRLNDVRLH